jgi:hypothetical protein
VVYDGEVGAAELDEKWAEYGAAGNGKAER